MTRASDTGDNPRTRMVQVAVGRIRREGLTVGLDHLSLESVIAEAGVSRATAYRHWPRKADFLREVLRETVRTTRLEGESEDDVDGLRQVVVEHAVEIGTEQGRRDLIVEALRRVSDPDFRRIAEAPAWQTYIALSATAHGIADQELREDLTAELRAAEAAFVAHRAQVYARLPRLLGYRLVPPLTGEEGFRIMSSAAGALMTGLVVQVLARPELATQTVELAPFGSSRPAAWTMPALHLTRMFLSHLEPDPEVAWGPARVAESLATLEEIARLLQASRETLPAREPWGATVQGPMQPRASGRDVKGVGPQEIPSGPTHQAATR